MALPRRKQTRLTAFDYRSSNAYFITICTQNRKALFWTGDALNACGKIAEEAIWNIPKHYPTVSVEHYAVMPNHVHLLLFLSGAEQFAPSVSTVVQQYKGSVTKRAGFPIWQKQFYDHVIRNEADYREKWNYIEQNPIKWTADEYHVGQSE